MNAVHVCFAIYDESGQYSKYLGIAMLSLLENTCGNVVIHVVTDGSLTDSNVLKFEQVVQKYNQRLIFYRIDKSRLEVFRDLVKIYTIGTLFRFFLPEILPIDLERIIYLDDDILVNVDIKDLWEYELEGNLIAACLDQGVQEAGIVPGPCKDGAVGMNEYFNAGVMVLNLKMLREYENFFKKCIEMLRVKKYTFVDQDVFNVLFHGSVSYLPKRFNLFSKYIRNRVNEEIEGIIHFGGDDVKLESFNWIDTMFLSYFRKSPWNEREYIYPLCLSYIRKQANRMDVLTILIKALLSTDVEFYIWGAKSGLCKQLYEISGLKEKVVAYIDNDEKLLGKNLCDKKIYSPVFLKERKGAFVIIASNNHYDDIKLELENMGKVENKNFLDARKILLNGKDLLKDKL